MLNLFIIEEIKRKEQEETQIPLQLPLYAPVPEELPLEPAPVPSDRGVIVIDL